MRRGKKLIGFHCLEEHICREEQRLYLESSMNLSPGVKDELRRRDVEIVHGVMEKLGRQA